MPSTPHIVLRVCQAFGKRLVDVRGIALDFPGMGRLSSKHGKVFMLPLIVANRIAYWDDPQINFKFFTEFLAAPGPTVCVIISRLLSCPMRGRCRTSPGIAGPSIHDAARQHALKSQGHLPTHLVEPPRGIYSRPLLQIRPNSYASSRLIQTPNYSTKGEPCHAYLPFI